MSNCLTYDESLYELHAACKKYSRRTIYVLIRKIQLETSTKLFELKSGVEQTFFMIPVFLFENVVYRRSLLLINSIFIFTRPFVFFPLGGAEGVDEELGLCEGVHVRFATTTGVATSWAAVAIPDPGGFVGTRWSWGVDGCIGVNSGSSDKEREARFIKSMLGSAVAVSPWSKLSPRDFSSSILYDCIELRKFTNVSCSAFVIIVKRNCRPGRLMSTTHTCTHTCTVCLSAPSKKKKLVIKANRAKFYSIPLAAAIIER